MSVILFYEATDIDQEQLIGFLEKTDHYWEFKKGTIQHEGINAGTEVLSVNMHSLVTKEVMDQMPKLRLIATRSSNVDHIDMDHAYQRGIIVVNVPEYGNNTVAEHAFTILLALARRIPQISQKVRNGRFRSDEFIGFDLEHRVMGIIGMGRIGRHTARIANGFGMEVIAYDPKEHKGAANELGFRYASLDEVLEKSDVLSLHAALNPDTYHMINSSTLGKMKKTAILINTANGQLVETRALLESLMNKNLAGAALDTIEGEQLLHSEQMIDAVSQNATSPTTYTQIAEMQALLRFNNVIITPHSGSATKEAVGRINQTTVDNITKFWSGEVQNQVPLPQVSGKLIVVRHAQSEWNALGKWTGTTNIGLTQQGRDRARQIGEKMKDIRIDFAYTSMQIRTHETLEEFLRGAGQTSVNSEQTKAINERDYGIYTGMKKNDILDVIGKNAYDLLRRSWDNPVEEGESLKDVYERTIPFYLRVILPRLRHGQNVLVVAHGNSIRAMVKYIENVSDDVIGETEMPHDCSYIYEVSRDGRAKRKDIITLE